ncbi:MAG: TonB-dependent receptor [Xanthomonadales bacterium]|nr:TonB-dependent receptor [Xanthomonadales bacterium]
MLKRSLKQAVVISLVAGAGASPLPLFSSDGMLEEVIVTARKRQESLQDVPLSINAFGDEALRAANVVGIDEVARLTPGLFFQFFDDTRPSTFIRGLGSRQFDAGSDGSVGIFFDEFYLSRFSGQMTGLYDIDRIEVLKGPQGTLYGRNTIGGAMNIISRDPTAERSGYAEIEYGNLNQLRVEGAISGPLAGERLTGRLAFVKHERDGHLTNLTTGTELQGEDMGAIRGKLRFEASDSLSALFSIEYNSSDRPGTQGEPIAGVFSAAPGISLVKTPDRRAEFFNEDSRFDRELLTLIGRVEWEPGPLSITSITGYRNSDLEEFRDLDSTRFDAIGQDTIEESDSISQELRLASTPGGVFTFNDRLDWVVGLYYFKEDTDRLDRFPFGPDSAISSIVNTFDTLGIPAPILPGVDTFYEDFSNNVDIESFAVFSQATFALTDRLNITGGLRWTRDEKRAEIIGNTTRPGLPPIFGDFTVNRDPNWESVDPKVTIDYQLTPESLLYLTFAEGFKSGGFQFAAFNPEAAGVVFEPEELTSYELGLKSDLWGGRMRLNASGFVYSYENQQLPRIVLLPSGSFGQVITNAAESDINGIEVDVSVAPTPGLMLSAGYAYLDATYDKFVFNEALDFSGNQMPRAPEHSYFVNVDYERPIGSGTGFVHADWSWQDDIFFEFDEGATIGTRQEAFGLLNVEAGFEMAQWRFAAWSKNLTDKTYRSSVLNFGGNTIEFLGLPRTYGLSVRYAFD